MNSHTLDLKKYAIPAVLMIGATLLSFPTMAIELHCTGPQMGEIFVDTTTGNVSKSAEETLKVEISTENTHYRFVVKSKLNQFKAIINRQTGQIILDDACIPACWGGPIFGTCTPIKAKF